MNEQYLEKFIVEAGKVVFTTGDGRRWRMRQPTPDEAANGDSAYRLAQRRVLEDKRLADLAGSDEELKREARIRASAAEAMYLLPLLLEKPVVSSQMSDGWLPAFDVFDAASMAEFEALEGAVITEMTAVFWGPIQQAIREAKKKPPESF